MASKKILSILLLFVIIRSFPAYSLTSKATEDVIALPFFMNNAKYGSFYGLLGKFNYLMDTDSSLIAAGYLSVDGGRGMQFTLSLPDKDELKGNSYFVAFDLIESFGHSVAERYYGLGEKTFRDEFSTFNNDHNNTTFQFSHGFDKTLVLQESIYFNYDRFSEIEEGRYFITSEAEDGIIDYSGINASLSYNTIDSDIEPSSGILCIANAGSGLNRAKFFRAGVDLRRYDTPFYEGQVLASRIMLTQMSGSNIPLYEYASLGSSNTLRGYPVSRFRDKSAALFNLEYRIPTPIDFYLLNGLRTVFFFESGKVDEYLSTMGLDDWSSDIGFGLHINMADQLLLRGDLGLGTEGINLYFTYQQAF